MAQNITLLGASYSDVPAVELPKTGGGMARFDDTTDADATAADVLSGKTAYVNGTKITGTAARWERVLVVTKSAVSSLPTTITDANITSDMVVVECVLSEPWVQGGNWTVTTADGSATVSGSMDTSGTTDITIIFAEG